TGNSRVLDTNFNLTLQNVTITGGNTGSSGAGLDFDGTVLRIENSTFAGNCTDDGAGGGVDIDGPDDGSAVTATIIGSTFSGNTAIGGAAINVVNAPGPTSFVMVNSTVTGNTSDNDGAIDIDSAVDATIVYSTIVANAHVANVSCESRGDATAEPDEAEAAEAAAEEQEALDEEGVDALVDGESANISVSETSDENPSTLRVFGTVVAQPQGGPNCSNDIGGNPPLALTASSGYNFSDDATCGFTNTSAGDRQSAGAPGLGALASNGGPTQTLLPSTASPLLDFIPLASCGGGDALAGFAVTTDQRGVTRPQGPGCEIGSVEIEVPVAITVVPKFTG
ncbi:MAG: right-handed parallel beta-helix repeat-containing protein, partial [Acidimicrobiia bacterium]